VSAVGPYRVGRMFRRRGFISAGTRMLSQALAAAVRSRLRP
jgi:hypothetical protein